MGTAAARHPRSQHMETRATCPHAPPQQAGGTLLWGRGAPLGQPREGTQNQCWGPQVCTVRGRTCTPPAPPVGRGGGRGGQAGSPQPHGTGGGGGDRPAPGDVLSPASRHSPSCVYKVSMGRRILGRGTAWPGGDTHGVAPWGQQGVLRGWQEGRHPGTHPAAQRTSHAAPVGDNASPQPRCRVPSCLPL